MKKAIILSLVFLFYYNGPAHAGWTKVVAEIGEILILWLDKDTFWLGQGEVMCPI